MCETSGFLPPPRTFPGLSEAACHFTGSCDESAFYPKHIYPARQVFIGAFSGRERDPRGGGGKTSRLAWGPGARRGAGRFCADPLMSLRPKTKGCHGTSGPTRGGSCSCFLAPWEGPPAPWRISEMPGPAPGKYTPQERRPQAEWGHLAPPFPSNQKCLCLRRLGLCRRDSSREFFATPFRTSSGP